MPWLALVVTGGMSAMHAVLGCMARVFKPSIDKSTYIVAPCSEY